MHFTGLLVRNLVRQRVRTALTVLGISIGIVTVVALGAITAGLRDTAAGVVRQGGSDFMVAQKGSADFTFSTVSEAQWGRLAARPDVASATGVLMHIVRAASNPYFDLAGVRAGQVRALAPPLTEGRPFSAAATNEILLGTRAARNLDAGVGDEVTIDRARFRVVGIYRSDVVFVDSSSYAPLATVQRLARKPGVVTAVYVRAARGHDAGAVAAAIERAFPTLTTVTGAGDYAEVDQGMELIDAANLAITLFALLIGAVVVMNTMVMAVFERTREIGVLRAVGWRGSRIARMIVGESLILAGLAAAVGVALGIAMTRALLLVPAIANFLQPRYEAAVFVRALLIASAVAVVGALYPAFRAVRLSPMEALRHE